MRNLVLNAAFVPHVTLLAFMITFGFLACGFLYTGAMPKILASDVSCHIDAASITDNKLKYHLTCDLSGRKIQSSAIDANLTVDLLNTHTDTVHCTLYDDDSVVKCKI